MTKQRTLTKDKIARYLGREPTEEEAECCMVFQYTLLRFPELAQIILDHEKSKDGFHRKTGH